MDNAESSTDRPTSWCHPAHRVHRFFALLLMCFLCFGKTIPLMLFLLKSASKKQTHWPS